MERKYEKVALVNPPLDKGWNESDRVDHWMPLNLLTLASHLRETGYEGEIKIFDQAVLPTTTQIIQALEEYSPDLVGISPSGLSTQNSHEIGRINKEKGAKIILGGNYPSILVETFLRNQEYIDGIIRSEGEIPFAKFTEGKPMNHIPGMAYLENGNLRLNPIVPNERATVSEVDYSLIELEPYFQNYERNLYPAGYKKPFPVLTQRGCFWRHVKKACFFCSHTHSDVKFDDPKVIWERLKKLKSTYGMDCFLDPGEDFTGNRKWLREFHKNRPKGMEDIGIRFLYARASNITNEVADILADLNVTEVFFGFESGDDRILKSSGKYGTAKQQIEALKRLEERKVGSFISFIAGLPGEDQDSLQNTIEQAKRVSEFKQVTGVSMGPLIPIPGSEAWDTFMRNPQIIKKYQGLDVFPAKQMTKDWVPGNCSVTYEEIMESIWKINEIMKSRGHYFRNQKINEREEATA